MPAVHSAPLARNAPTEAALTRPKPPPLAAIVRVLNARASPSPAASRTSRSSSARAHYSFDNDQGSSPDGVVAAFEQVQQLDPTVKGCDPKAHLANWGAATAGRAVSGVVGLRPTTP